MPSFSLNFLTFPIEVCYIELNKKKGDISMATLFTIKIDDSKRPQPEYMDMVIHRPRKASKFKSSKDYTRKQKHKKDWE